MATIYVKNTGNDTTGDGSLATPYATIGKAMTVHTQRDTIALLSGIELSTKVTITTYATYKINSIIGVNDSGIEDGTRRRIYGNGGCDYAFDLGTSYTWSFRNLDFDTFTEKIFQNGANSYNLKMINFSVSYCKGIGTNLGNTSEYRDFELHHCTNTTTLHYLNSTSTMHNGLIYDCNVTANGYILQAANSIIEDVIITNCSVAGTTYAIIYNPKYVKNVIIDRCVCTGAVSVLVWCTGGLMRDILISNCTLSGATRKVLFFGISSPMTLDNVAIYNTTVAEEVVSSSNIDNLKSGVNYLTESPYQVDDGVNFALKSSYAYRRVRKTLGAFYGNAPVVQVNG